MLVVRRVDVREVDAVELGGETSVGVLPWPAGPSIAAGSRSSSTLAARGAHWFQIGHLHADGRVDAVGGLDEAREQDGARNRIEVEAVDLVAGRRRSASPFSGRK